MASPGPFTMQPMTAMVTPGRWPVALLICSVTVCRSNSVLRPPPPTHTHAPAAAHVRPRA